MKANLHRTIKQGDASRIQKMVNEDVGVDDIAATLDIHVDIVARFIDGMPSSKPIKAKKKVAKTETPNTTEE